MRVKLRSYHYIDVIMTTMASQITSPTVVYSTVYSDADQRKHQSSASLAFVWGIHRDRWIPRTKGQLRGKCLHLMTSSWWPPFRRWPLQMHSHERKVMHFDSNFTEVCSLESNWQCVSIGSGNGMVPSRRQAITWTNADLAYWRICTAQGGDKLRGCTSQNLWRKWPGNITVYCALIIVNYAPRYPRPNDGNISSGNLVSIKLYAVFQCESSIGKIN